MIRLGFTLIVLFVGTDATTENVARFQNLDGCEIVRTNAMNDTNRLRALVSLLLLGRYRPFVRARGSAATSAFARRCMGSG